MPGCAPLHTPDNNDNVPDGLIVVNFTDVSTPILFE